MTNSTKLTREGSVDLETLSSAAEHVRLGEHIYEVTPQRIGYLRSKLGVVFTQLTRGDLDGGVVEIVLNKAHDILSVFIPDLMDGWEWEGYASERLYQQVKAHEAEIDRLTREYADARAEAMKAVREEQGEARPGEAEEDRAARVADAIREALDAIPLPEEPEPPDVYDEAADRSPDPEQIAIAVGVVMRANKLDLVKHLGKIVDPTVLKKHLTKVVDDSLTNSLQSGSARATGPTRGMISSPAPPTSAPSTTSTVIEGTAIESGGAAESDGIA